MPISSGYTYGAPLQGSVGGWPAWKGKASAAKRANDIFGKSETEKTPGATGGFFRYTFFHKKVLTQTDQESHNCLHQIDQR